MGLSHWVFGIGAELSWWYFGLIAIPYLVLQLWAVWRLKIAVDRGRRIGRAPYVAQALSWACAIGFGFTSPNMTAGAEAGLTGEQMTSVLSHLAGNDWIGMSIALCNPFGIIAMSTAIFALVFAYTTGRPPRTEEDEQRDLEAFATESGMVPHPYSEDSP